MRSELRTTPFSLCAGVFVTLLLLQGCQPKADSASEQPELVAEDVGPSVEISIENDIQAAPPKKELVGVMPSTFPEDLPVHLPSSLVNFGDGEEGPWVELLTPDSRSTLESALRQLLASERWSINEVGSVWLLEKGQRRARLQIGEDGAGTLYRYDF